MGTGFPGREGGVKIGCWRPESMRSVYLYIKTWLDDLVDLLGTGLGAYKQDTGT
jgi:hypothetical protein